MLNILLIFTLLSLTTCITQSQLLINSTNITTTTPIEQSSYTALFNESSSGMAGKGRDGRGKKSKSSQAAAKTKTKPSKSAKKKPRAVPKPDLIKAAETVLKNDTNKTQIVVSGFTWTDTLLSDIKAEYESMPHGKTITAADTELLRKQSWQKDRMAKARSDLGIGVVKKRSNGGDVGDVSAVWKRSNVSRVKARQNTTDEKGPLQTFDLPVAKLESIIELGEDLSRNSTIEVPQDLIEYFPIGNDEAATAGAIEDFEGVMSITKAVFLIEEMNLTGAELDGMDHPEIDERVDVFMAENFSHLDKESKEYEEEAGVRKFTLHFVKCRMTSVKEALKKGDAFLIPVKIEVDGKIIRFKAVFTVGGKKDEIERRAIELLRTICPGQSHNWYGSQANNKHSIMIADTFICSPTLGIWFDTDATRTTASKIKDKKDRESGQFDSISVKLHGKERKMRQMYMNETEVGVNVVASRFVVSLRKPDASIVAEMKSKRQNLTHEVSSDTSLVAASNTMVVSSPIAIEEQTRLPPKKHFLQRMQVSELSVGVDSQLLTTPEVIMPSSHSIIPVFNMRVELDIIFPGTVVEVEPGSRDGTYSLTVWLDNGTTRRDVEYPSEDVYVIGRLGNNDAYESSAYSSTLLSNGDSAKDSSDGAVSRSSRKRKQPSPGSTPPPEPDDIDSDAGTDQEVEVYDDSGSGKKDKTHHTIQHHRANNIMASRAGLDSNDQELAEYLKTHDKSCLEAMYLTTGDSQVDESMTGDSQVVDELLERSRLDVALEDMEEVVSREKVPQGQSDVDHCLHRSHWISNSIYLCFPMSHTANTCNSIIRRRANDWLYCLTIHEYTNGA